MGWKARAAQAVRRMLSTPSRLIISTDDPEIQAEATKHGVEVPFTRPAELATDTASSASVIRHAIEYLQAQGENYSRVMLLEPSAPFSTPEHMTRAIMMYEAFDADLIVGMKETFPHTAFIGEMRDDASINPIVVRMRRHGKHLRRQDLPREWTASGTIYLFRTEMFMATSDLYGGRRNFGLLTDEWHAIEIDNPVDMEMAQYAVINGHVKLLGQS